jgi:hypothetical protein
MPDTFVEARIIGVNRQGKPDRKVRTVTCLYNPETLTYNQANQWSSQQLREQTQPEHVYAGGAGTTVGMTLFFDSTRPVKKNNVAVSLKQDVRDQIKLLLALMQVVREDKRPPYCRFEWGGSPPYYFYVGYVQSVNVTYQLFRPNGMPIRAQAAVTFGVIQEKKQAQNPTSRSEGRKTWVVHEGERLDWIAYQEYGDPALWRYIAETNGLRDPFCLPSGQILKIVPLPD